jgi:hypothetical protein
MVDPLVGGIDTGMDREDATRRAPQLRGHGAACTVERAPTSVVTLSASSAGHATTAA